MISKNRLIGEGISTYRFHEGGESCSRNLVMAAIFINSNLQEKDLRVIAKKKIAGPIPPSV
jgi:hypothetical protein